MPVGDSAPAGWCRQPVTLSRGACAGAAAGVLALLALVSYVSSTGWGGAGGGGATGVEPAFKMADIFDRSLSPRGVAGQFFGGGAGGERMAAVRVGALQVLHDACRSLSD